MKIKMFQVDAFTDKLFGGNPAAVCILDSWLDKKVMQAIAAENNLAETAFIAKAEDGGYSIRWFTPTVEVNLCGHATLAAAHVIFNYLEPAQNELKFQSKRSGLLKVRKNGDYLTLDFPVDDYEKVETPEDLAKGLGAQPLETYRGKTDYMAILSSEDEVAGLEPHYQILATLDCRGIIVTARGEHTDFVSRFFAPQSGITEDPVTGSSHTTLTPYWAGELDKRELSAVQLSPRKGYLRCRHNGNRVEITGNAVTYLQGEIEVDQ